MNFKKALAKLEKSKEFKNFKKENPESYLCAAFFVIDFESQQNTQQLDFQLPDKKIAIFSLNETDNTISMKIEETPENKIISKIKQEIKIDLNDVQKIAEKETQKQKIASEMKKIITILQTHDKKQIWNVTCIFASLLMLRIHIDCMTGKIVKLEKSSMFDFVKKA